MKLTGSLSRVGIAHHKAVSNEQLTINNEQLRG